MIGFLIGRFQPFHLGHLEAIKFALSKVEHLHLAIGSSNKSHEKRNPFTDDERKKMIILIIFNVYSYIKNQIFIYVCQKLNLCILPKL